MNVGSVVNLGKLVASAVFVVAAGFGEANAASQIDSEGKGFVGKGDIQLVMMWNNHELQSNAGSLRFRMLSGDGTSWKCEGVNAAGKAMVTVQEKDFGVESDVAFDPRRNRNGQVTGFYLRGTTGQVGYTAVGMCPNARGWQVPPTLVADSIIYSGGEPALQFSADGETWFELTLTY